MRTRAIVLESPEHLSLSQIALDDPVTLGLRQ